MEIRTTEQALEAVHDLANVTDAKFDRYARKRILNNACWGYMSQMQYQLNSEKIANDLGRPQKPEMVQQMEERRLAAEDYVRWAVSIVRHPDDIEAPADTVQSFVQNQGRPGSADEQMMDIENIMDVFDMDEDDAKAYLEKNRQTLVERASGFAGELATGLLGLLKQGLMRADAEFDNFEPTPYQQRSISNTLVGYCENQISRNIEYSLGARGARKMALGATNKLIKPVMLQFAEWNAHAEKLIEILEERETVAPEAETETVYAADFSTETREQIMERLCGGLTQ